MPATDPIDRPVVHLLPNYDELLVSFRDRTDAMDPALPPAAQVAQVILAHIIVRDALVVGGWRRIDEGSSVRVEPDFLVPLDEREQEALRRRRQAVRDVPRPARPVAGRD